MDGLDGCEGLNNENKRLMLGPLKAELRQIDFLDSL